ncbi:hypothetical protein KEN51_CDS0139 [Pseudomonas phage vB_Pae10145-KEN51]
MQDRLYHDLLKRDPYLFGPLGPTLLPSSSQSGFDSR